MMGGLDSLDCSGGKELKNKGYSRVHRVNLNSSHLHSTLVSFQFYKGPRNKLN